MKRHLATLVLVAVLAAPLLYAGSSSTGLRGTDELRYAQIAANLGPGKAFFLTEFNGRRYTEKPPLYFWTVALSFEALGGVSGHALRLPGQLAALLAAWLTYALCVSLGGRRDLAVLAALTLLVMPRFLWIARWGRLDLVMSLCVYTSLVCLARSYFVTRTRLGSYGWWTGLGLAFAVKGPAGPAIGLAGALCFLAWQREWHRWRELFAPGPLALALAINLAWFGPILWWSEADAVRDLVVRQNLERALAPWRHVKAFYYYAATLWYDAFPAFATCAAAGAVWAWRSRRGAPASAAGGAGPRWLDAPRQRFLASWFLAPFLIFSLFYQAKRGQYLLPLYPVLAIGAVVFLDGLAERFGSGTGSRLERWAFRLTLGPTLLVVAGALFALTWFAPASEAALAWLTPRHAALAELLAERLGEFAFRPPGSPVAVRTVGALAVVALLSAGGAAVVRLRPRQALALCVAGAYVGWLGLFGWIAPARFPADELPRLARDVAARASQRAQTQVLVYGDETPYWNVDGEQWIYYYDRREIWPFRGHLRGLDFIRRPFVAIVAARRWDRVADERAIRDLPKHTLRVYGEPYYVIESPGVRDAASDSSAPSGESPPAR